MNTYSVSDPTDLSLSISAPHESTRIHAYTFFAYATPIHTLCPLEKQKLKKEKVPPIPSPPFGSSPNSTEREKNTNANSHIPTPTHHRRCCIQIYSVLFCYVFR